MSSANSGNVSSYSDIEILPSYFSWSTITHPWIQSLHNYLWWWDTRCPRVSRWTGGTQSAPDSWGTGSPPAPDQSPERLHLSNWKRSPPAGTRERRSNEAGTEASDDRRCSGSVLTCSMPVPSVSMVPCDVTCSFGIVSLQLPQKNKENLTGGLYRCVPI